MASTKVTLDRNGIEQILTGAAVSAMVMQFANRVAASARSEHPDVEITAEEYDFTPSRRAGRRAAVAVTYRRPDGKGQQARTGLFTRIAAQHGAEVTDRP